MEIQNINADWNELKVTYPGRWTSLEKREASRQTEKLEIVVID